MAKRTARGKRVPTAAPSPADGRADDSRLKQWRLHMEAHLETLRLRAEQTRNPIYIWEAIATCGMADYPRYPLPEWCLVYLTTVASMFWTTGKLQNTLTYPVKDKMATDEQYNERVQKWAETARITSKAALERVPQILCFSDGRSRNAFFDYYKNQKEIADAIMAEAPAPPGFIDPIEWVSKRRSVERKAASDRIRRGRKLLHPKRDT